MPKICNKNIQKNFRFFLSDKMIFNPKWDKKEKASFSKIKIEPAVISVSREPVSDLDDVMEKWKRMGF